MSEPSKWYFGSMDDMKLIKVRVFVDGECFTRFVSRNELNKLKEQQNVKVHEVPLHKPNDQN